VRVQLESANRLFLAINLSQQVNQDIFDAVHEVQSSHLKLNWLKKENYHLTLKFLGETPSLLIPSVISAVQSILPAHPEFQVEAFGVGAFPRESHARVIWVGIRDLQSRLKKLAEEIDTALVPLGFQKEKKGFRPHLTICRLREPKNVLPVLNSFRRESFGISLLKEVILYESHLTPTGSFYTPLSRMLLPVRQNSQTDSSGS
jgi:RNA 2',3'-cyclic 3'-phosphodiesterase